MKPNVSESVPRHQSDPNSRLGFGRGRAGPPAHGPAVRRGGGGGGGRQALEVGRLGHQLLDGLTKSGVLLIEGRQKPDTFSHRYDNYHNYLEYCWKKNTKTKTRSRGKTQIFSARNRDCVAPTRVAGNTNCDTI